LRRLTTKGSRFERCPGLVEGGGDDADDKIDDEYAVGIEEECVRVAIGDEAGFGAATGDEAGFEAATGDEAGFGAATGDEAGFEVGDEVIFEAATGDEAGFEAATGDDEERDLDSSSANRAAGGTRRRHFSHGHPFKGPHISSHPPHQQAFCRF
jgi:hypothetical protein